MSTSITNGVTEMSDKGTDFVDIEYLNGERKCVSWGDVDFEYTSDKTYLTKREQVLKDFMSAMLSNPEMDYGNSSGPKSMAEDAMKYVDAYLKELEK